MTYEEAFDHILIQICHDLQDGVYQAEWARADFAKQLVAAIPRDRLKSICKRSGISHRRYEGWALLAERFPPDARRKEYSVREHSRWLRAGLSDGEIDDSLYRPR